MENKSLKWFPTNVFVRSTATVLFLLPVSSTGSIDNAVTAGVDPAYLIKTVIALCFVLIVIFLLSKLLRTFNTSGKLNSGPIRVLAGTQLGSRERLVLVQAGDTQLLLGVSPAGIVKLEKFEQPVVSDDEIVGSSFKDQLQNLIRQQGS